MSCGGVRDTTTYSAVERSDAAVETVVAQTGSAEAILKQLACGAGSLAAKMVLSLSSRVTSRLQHTVLPESGRDETHLEYATQGRRSEADHGNFEAGIAELPTRQCWARHCWARHCDEASPRSAEVHGCKAGTEATMYQDHSMLASQCYTCLAIPRHSSLAPLVCCWA
jgi:hypothetical protein